MKHAAKNCLKQLYLQQRERLFYKRWRQTASKHNISTAEDERSSLIIFPSDSLSIIGSLGDEAIITASIEYLKTHNKDINVSVLCSTKQAANIVASKGWQPIRLPKKRNYANQISKYFRNNTNSSLIVLGCDAMDGYYNAEYTAEMIVAADLAAKAGLKSTILGFSFNKKPNYILKKYYQFLDKRVAINVRDPVSKQRFEHFTNISPTLVSDVAFLLKPSQIEQKITDWIKKEKSESKLVFGLNVHPLLFKDLTPAEVCNFYKALSGTMIKLSSRYRISWLLIPHDSRIGNGRSDRSAQEILLAHLQERVTIETHYLSGSHSASELKGLTSHLDGIITGRMHLAIAALGMGTPTLCFAYQDKFQGLIEQFSLPKSLTIEPGSDTIQEDIEISIEHLINERKIIKKSIQSSIHAITQSAKNNFKSF